MPATAFDPAALAEAARVLAAVGRDLHARGWSPATSSNYSMRLGRDAFAITVSGKHKGQLTEDDIMAVDLDGRPLMPKKPSAETLLHAQLYRWSAEIGAVLHTHSPTATVLSRLRPEPHLELSGYELLKAFRGIATHEVTLRIPVFPNNQDIPALAGEVQAFLEAHGDCYAYILRGHGLYTWGSTIEECQRHLEALEYLLTCELETLRIPRSPT